MQEIAELEDKIDQEQEKCAELEELLKQNDPYGQLESLELKYEQEMQDLRADYDAEIQLLEE